MLTGVDQICCFWRFFVCNHSFESSLCMLSSIEIMSTRVAALSEAVAQVAVKILFIPKVRLFKRLISR